MPPNQFCAWNLQVNVPVLVRLDTAQSAPLSWASLTASCWLLLPGQTSCRTTWTKTIFFCIAFSLSPISIIFNSPLTAMSCCNVLWGWITGNTDGKAFVLYKSHLKWARRETLPRPACSTSLLANMTNTLNLFVALGFLRSQKCNQSGFAHIKRHRRSERWSFYACEKTTSSTWDSLNSLIPFTSDFPCMW